MPFHVEVSSSPNHARIFNVGEAELWQTVLEPWLRGQAFALGEQEWDPRESKLTILEGKALDPPDLSFGQGWSNALRSAKDVTRAALDAAELQAPLPGAAVIEADSLDAALEQIESGAGPTAIAWAQAAERIDGRDPKIAAVILVVRPSEPAPQRN